MNFKLFKLRYVWGGCEFLVYGFQMQFSQQIFFDKNRAEIVFKLFSKYFLNYFQNIFTFIFKTFYCHSCYYHHHHGHPNHHHCCHHYQYHHCEEDAIEIVVVTSTILDIVLSLRHIFVKWSSKDRWRSRENSFVKTRVALKLYFFCQ